MKIPGLSFSWKRAVGITGVKQKIARKTGIPTTKQGLERKIGGFILKSLFGKKSLSCRSDFLSMDYNQKKRFLAEEKAV